MCHKGYKEMSAKDFGAWDEWVAAVNANYQYCKALPKHRLREFRFKCPYWKLPSFHPYWRRCVHLDTIKRGQRHIENLKACEKDRSLIKVLYNINTSLEDIRRRVAAIPTRRQSW